MSSPQVRPPDSAAALGYELPAYDFARPEEMRTGRRIRHKVVIVGGGLTGLTAACDLANRGIKGVLLDDDNTVGVRGFASRGPCVARKSLEIFDRLGIYDRIKAKGETWYVGRVLNGHDEIYSFNLDPDASTKQPPFVNLQQYYTEWFLVERIYELGNIEIRWKNRVTAVRQAKDHVVLTVETPDGSYEVEAEWVLAADGVGSPVREALRIEPVTERMSDQWCISDVRFKKQFPMERWVWIEAPFNGNRACWQHKMADQVWRLDFQMAPDSDPDDVSRPEIAAQRIRERLGPEVEFEIVWVGPWMYRTHLMDDFRAGRVFFLGDAAHLMSPFGARGGNSGIQDSDNLGWKLALVLEGKAPARLLDSYTEERRPAAQHNIQTTKRAARFLAPVNAAERALRRAVLGLSKDFPFARALVNGGRMSVAYAYDGMSGCGPGGGAAAINPRVKLPNGKLGHLFDLARAGTQFIGLYFGGKGASAWPAVAKLNDGALPLQSYRVGSAKGDVGDIDGWLARKFDAKPGTYILLRPDQHVAAVVPKAGASQVAKMLRKALGYPTNR